jgi:hypothetical protein
MAALRMVGRVGSTGDFDHCLEHLYNADGGTNSTQEINMTWMASIEGKGNCINSFMVLTWIL